MIWAKRRFEFGDYWPHQEQLKRLQASSPALSPQFILVSTDTDRSYVRDYYIGVPDETFLGAFQEFDPVSETELPRKIDSVQLADVSSHEFRSRFQLRSFHQLP